MPDLPQTIEVRKRRWSDFLSGKPDAPRRMLIVHYWPGRAPRPLPRPDNVSDRIEWSWQSYQRHLRHAESIDDDYVPMLDVYTGTEIFAEAFGCEVSFPADSMPHARPLVSCAAAAERLRVPPVDSRSLARLFDIADELRRRAGPQAVMKVVDIQSPMDIAALIWDKTDFYLAMLDSPQAVRELAAKTHALLTAFLDQWFARYGRAFIAHCPEMYMPAGISLSEDEIGIVSPELFDEFFLPELVELSSRYGGMAMHCCANSQHHWPNILRIPHLRLLNLKRELAPQAYPFFANHCAQNHGAMGEAEYDDILARNPTARIVIEVSAKDEADAQRLVTKYRR